MFVQSFSQSYTVVIDEIPYDTLTEYNSLGFENLEHTNIYFVFNKEFEFGFDFPYFDTIINSVILENYAIGDIEGCLEYPMYLFSQNFQLHVEKEPVPNLESDFRYKYDEIDGKKVFIFEFKKVVYQEDHDRPKFERNHFSFQHWFWENGDIEIRFGDSYILPELYQPGVGIKDELNDRFNHFALQISNYTLTENINISGNLNDNPMVDVTNTWSQDFPGITYIPQKNTVCRFKKLPSKTNDQTLKWKLPNIITDQFIIPENIDIRTYQIYDMLGNPLLSGSSKVIDVQGLQSGNYFISLMHKNGMDTFKFIKI